jgi:hypothetical protein
MCNIVALQPNKDQIPNLDVGNKSKNNQDTYNGVKEDLAVKKTVNKAKAIGKKKSDVQMGTTRQTDKMITTANREALEEAVAKNRAGITFKRKTDETNNVMTAAKRRANEKCAAAKRKADETNNVMTAAKRRANEKCAAAKRKGNETDNVMTAAMRRTNEESAAATQNKIESEHAIIANRIAEEEAAANKKVELVKATAKTLSTVKNSASSKLLEEVTIENKTNSSCRNIERGRSRIRSDCDHRSYSRSSEPNNESNKHKVYNRSRSRNGSHRSKNNFIIYIFSVFINIT